MRQQLLELGADAPSLEDCPRSIEDFPHIVHNTMEIYELLPDEYIIAPNGKTLYKGKDLSTINTFFELFYVDNIPDKKLIIELIGLLDVKTRKALNKK
jgi:lysine/ornithine N-monooxygenase